MIKNDDCLFCGDRRAAKALFLDRDGIINVDFGYVGTPERFVFMDGVLLLAKRAFNQGYRLVVATNQSGIARGYYSEADFAAVTQVMRDGFAAAEAPLTAVLHCPYHRDGAVAAYARDSYWRKPNPGMILEAARRFDLDLARSIFIGDAASDMIAARQAGVGRRARLAPAGTADPDADFVAGDLKEIARRLDFV